MRRLSISIVTSCLIGFCLSALPLIARAEEPAVSARLLASNPSPYLGEEIDLLLEVTYNRHPGGRTRVDWPNLDGFVSSDLTAVRSKRNHDTQNRLVETISRRIRPLKSGVLPLQHAVIQAGRIRQTLPPLTLRVKPLPVTGRPNLFDNRIGSYRLALEADGTGPREITLHIYDSNRLSSVPKVLSWTGAGEKLISLEKKTLPDKSKGREHTLRYYYIPDEGRTGDVRFSLTTFDPQQRKYIVVETKPAQIKRSWSLAPVMVSATILLIVVLAIYRLKRPPQTINGCLEKLCQRTTKGLSREKIQAMLQHCLDQDGRAALQRYWQSVDELRYHKNRPNDKAATRLISESLRRHLWKAIDKQQDNP